MFYSNATVRAVMLFTVMAGAAAGQALDGYLGFGVGSGPGSALAEPVGGGEVLLHQTIGLGGELGAALRDHGSFGYLSLDPSFHFPARAAGKKFDPFVVGGYTRAFELFSGVNGGNFGFGLNYWLSHGLGIRGEFRDMVLSGSNYWAFRVGIAFR